MNSTYVGLSILDGLLFWFLASSKGQWFMKVALIIVVCVFNAFVFSSANSGSGWPVRSVIPNEAKFIACVVNEPTPTDSGNIEFWVIQKQQKSLFGYQSGPGVPKSYEEPYSRSLHVLCIQALNAEKRGESVGIKTKGGKRSNGNASNSDRGRYHLYHFPTPRLPQKGH